MGSGQGQVGCSEDFKIQGQQRDFPLFVFFQNSTHSLLTLGLSQKINNKINKLTFNLA